MYFAYSISHSTQGKNGYSRVKDFLQRSLSSEACNTDTSKKKASGQSSEQSSPGSVDEGFVSPTRPKPFNLQQKMMQPD